LLLLTQVGPGKSGLSVGVALAAGVKKPAPPHDPADDLVNDGVELRRAGKDREALTKFKEAQQISDTPKVTAQVGFAEQALGLWIASQSHLEKALSSKGDDWIERNRKTIDTALQMVNGHVGRVDVWGTPAGAEVLFDGEIVGRLPLEAPIRVAQERINLEVRAPRYISLTRSVNVQLGQLSREAVELRSATGIISSSSTNQPGSLLGQPGGASGETQSDQPAYTRWWFWTAAGVVVAGGVVAAVLVTRGRSGSDCAAGTTCQTWSALTF